LFSACAFVGFDVGCSRNRNGRAAFAFLGRISGARRVPFAFLARTSSAWRVAHGAARYRSPVSCGAFCAARGAFPGAVPVSARTSARSWTFDVRATVAGAGVPLGTGAACDRPSGGCCYVVKMV
jgi:hypothetical protein